MISQSEANIMLGKRLKEARNNLGRTQAEMADVLGVTEEHYRRYEAGATGLSSEKLYRLYLEYGINPTYLVTGFHAKNHFDPDYYMANSDREHQNAFIDMLFAYMLRVMKR